MTRKRCLLALPVNKRDDHLFKDHSSLIIILYDPVSNNNIFCDFD